MTDAKNFVCAMAGFNAEARTVAEVNDALENAKLNRSELKDVSQVLSFSSDFTDRNVILLELDTTLSNQITHGDSLTLRGDKGDYAVLCTRDKTYSVKEAETSNSLLLLEDLNWPQAMHDDGEIQLVPREVVGVHHSYLEVSPCRPRLRRAAQLLQQNYYRGQEYENDNTLPKFTFEDLIDKVQASERELRSYLQEIEAYNVNGFLRLLEFQYSCRVLTHMFNLLEENSWSFRHVPKKEILDTLDNLEPRSILEQCFNYYSFVTEGNGDQYSFDENKVCRFFARILLKSADRFSLQEFTEMWKQCVPEGMNTDVKQLEGIALIDKSSRPGVIFPVPDLPDDVTERFQFLFKLKPQWSFEEIEPFIRCLTTEKLDVNGLLTKHARVSVVNGVRLYSSKKPLHSKFR